MDKCRGGIYPRPCIFFGSPHRVSPTFPCLCEERSDEAISIYLEIASPFGFAMTMCRITLRLHGKLPEAGRQGSPLLLGSYLLEQILCPLVPGIF